MEQIIRALQQSTRQLHNRIRGGGGFEETRNIARKIGTLLNDADVASRGIMTSAWVAERVRPAMVLINEIAPYYGSEPLYDPESLQRVDRPVNRDTPPAPEAPPAPE